MQGELLSLWQVLNYYQVCWFQLRTKLRSLLLSHSGEQCNSLINASNQLFLASFGSFGHPVECRYTNTTIVSLTLTKRLSIHTDRLKDWFKLMQQRQRYPNFCPRMVKTNKKQKTLDISCNETQYSLFVKTSFMGELPRHSQCTPAFCTQTY